jgi:hypothetical protein
LMQTIRFASHHAQKPSSEKNKDGPANSHLHNRDFPERPGQPIAHAIRRKIHSAKSFTAPLNPRRRPLGRRTQRECFHSRQRTTIPGQTSQPNDGTLDPSADRSRITRAQRRTRT